MSTSATDRLFKYAMTKAMNRLHSVKAGKYITGCACVPHSIYQVR